jgi:peptidoglycan hydrolase CwlO-like protein
MFLFGTKFYIIFISIWIIGLYFVLTTFHLSSNSDSTSDDRIKYLQDEVNSLQEKIRQIQPGSNDQPMRCQDIADELKLVKRQLKEKTSGTTAPQRMNHN